MSREGQSLPVEQDGAPTSATHQLEHTRRVARGAEPRHRVFLSISGLSCDFVRRLLPSVTDGDVEIKRSVESKVNNHQYISMSSITSARRRVSVHAKRGCAQARAPFECRVEYIVAHKVVPSKSLSDLGMHRLCQGASASAIVRVRVWRHRQIALLTIQ